MNRFDFVHEEIQRKARAKMDLYEQFIADRQNKLNQSAAEADLMMDRRRDRKQRSRGLSLN